MLRPASLMLGASLAISGAFARASTALPEDFTVEGRLYDQSGVPLGAEVDFKLELYDENTPACVLYRELRAGVDLRSTDLNAVGAFSLRLGAVTPDFASVPLATLFAPGAIAGDGCSANAPNGSHRLVRVSVRKTGDPSYETLSPDTRITAVPLAKVAENALGLQGVGTSGLILVNGTSALNQANVESVFSLSNFAKLQSLLGGSSSAYLSSTPTAPVDFNGQRLVDLADPTQAQDAATKAYADRTVAGFAIDTTAVGPMTGDANVIKWDATAGKWVTAPENRNPTGAAGGALTGTYPNPGLASGVVGTVNVANDAITAAKISSSGGGTNRLLLTDATTGTTVGYGTCATNEVYAWTTNGWACSSVSALAPVTSVAGRTGAVTLGAADVSGLGTSAIYDYGTAAGQMVRLDASAALPAVDGSNLTSINAVKLQGRPVSAATPTSNQVLAWNGSAWAPAQGTTGTVTTVATGPGLLGGPITTGGTLAVDLGTAAGQVLQLDANAMIPAVDGSQLANVNATRLASRAVATTTPLDAQVLGWNQTTSQWTPVVASTGTVTSVFGGNGILGGPVTSTGTLAVDAGTAASKIVQLNGQAQIAIASGSANLPAYTFAADPDSGMYGPTPGQLALTTNGTPALSVSSTQTVGIGTSPSAARLGVNGTFETNGLIQSSLYSANSIALVNNQIDPKGLRISAMDSINLLFDVNNSGVGGFNVRGKDTSSANAIPYFTVANNGNAGVGTAVPQAGLDVATTGTGGSAMIVPRDTTANRPSVPVNGMLRYNSDSNAMEGFIGGVWSTLASGSSAGTVVNVAGGTGILGGPITTSGTLSVDVGTTAAKIVQLNQNAQTALMAGSASTPSYSFAGNASTGVFSPAINQLALATNGTAALTVNAIGNVGIGTSVAGRALVVAGGSGMSVLTSTGTSEAITLTTSGSTGSLDIKNGGNTYVHLTGGANSYLPSNVGIGTSLPMAGLDIATVGTAASAVIVPRDTTTNRPANPVNGMLRYNTSLGAMEGYIGGIWSTLASGSSAGTVTNVAGGTGILGGPITTAGTLSVDVGTAANKIVQLNPNAQVAPGFGTASSPAYSFAGNASTGVFAPSVGNLALSSVGTTALTVAPNQNVGIGTSTPSRRLTVFDPNTNGGIYPLAVVANGGPGGAGKYVSVMIDNKNTTGGYKSGLEFWNNGFGKYSINVDYNGDSSNSLTFYDNVANSVRMMIDPRGFVGIGTQTPQAGLDLALTGTGSAVIVPRDSTTNRPTAPVNGMLRYNTTSNAMEGYVNGGWSSIVTGSTAGTVTNIVASTGLLGGTITTSGTLSVDVGTAANKIAQLNPNAQIAPGPGSAALPSHSFAGNPTTGLFSPGAGSLSLAAAGTAALTIGSSQTIGIGTSAGSNKVTIFDPTTNTIVTPLVVSANPGTGGPGSAVTVQINNQTPSASKTGLEFLGNSVRKYSIAVDAFGSGATNMQFYDNSSNQSRLYIDPNGLIAMGTSTNPQAGLDLGFTGTAASAVIVPRDSTTNRPSVPVNGMLRYNTTSNAMEGYINNVWSTISAGSSAGTVTNIVASTGLLGGTITTNGTLSVDVGTTANKIAQLNPNAQFAPASGTAALPSYSFVGNAATGMFSSGSNQLALATSGSAALSVLSNGFVGLNSSSPQSRLEVNGGMRVMGPIAPTSGAGIEMQFNSGIGQISAYDRSGPAFKQLIIAGNPLQLNGASGTGISVNAAGYVGIGGVSPQAALDVNVTGTAASAIIVPRDTTLNRPSNPVNGMIRYNTNLNAMEGYLNGLWATFSTNLGSSGTVTSVGSGNGLLGGPITSSGSLSVDVGSTAGKILQVDSSNRIPLVDGSLLTNLNASALATGNIPLARFGTVSGNQVLAAPTGASGSPSFRPLLSTDLPSNTIYGGGSSNYHPKFSGGTSLTNSMIWDNGTNVGINTTSPSYTMDVNGTVRANAGLTISNGGFINVTNSNQLPNYPQGGLGQSWNRSGGGAEVNFYNLYPNSPTAFVFSQRTSAPASAPVYSDLMTIDGVGNVTAAGYFNSSDERLKRNIETLDHSLEKISSLRGVSYFWRDPNRSSGQQVGFIAQEVEKVYPEVVQESAQGIKGVDYGHLVAPLVEAVKTLKRENDDLRARLERLERKLDH